MKALANLVWTLLLIAGGLFLLGLSMVFSLYVPLRQSAASLLNKAGERIATARGQLPAAPVPPPQSPADA